MGDELIKGKDKREILHNMTRSLLPGELEQHKMAIFIDQVEELEKSINTLKDSMNENAKSNDKLAKRVFWLNVVIAIATVASAIIAYFSLTAQ